MNVSGITIKPGLTEVFTATGDNRGAISSRGKRKLSVEAVCSLSRL